MDLCGHVLEPGAGPGVVHEDVVQKVDAKASNEGSLILRRRPLLGFLVSFNNVLSVKVLVGAFNQRP